MNLSKRLKTDWTTILILLFLGTTLTIWAFPLTKEERTAIDESTDTLERDSLLPDTANSLLTDGILTDSTTLDSTISDTADSTLSVEPESSWTLSDTVAILQAALKQEFWPKNIISTVILADTNVKYAWLPKIEGIHFIIMDKKKRQDKVLRGGDFMYHRVDEIDFSDSLAIIKIFYEWEPPRQTQETYLEVWSTREENRWRADKVFHYREVEN